MAGGTASQSSIHSNTKRTVLGSTADQRRLCDGRTLAGKLRESGVGNCALFGCRNSKTAVSLAFPSLDLQALLSGAGRWQNAA